MSDLEFDNLTHYLLVYSDLGIVIISAILYVFVPINLKMRIIGEDIKSFESDDSCLFYIPDNYRYAEVIMSVIKCLWK